MIITVSLPDLNTAFNPNHYHNGMGKKLLSLKADGIASGDQIDVLYFLEEIESQPKFDDAIPKDIVETLEKLYPQESHKKRG